jgi:GGDEF domain-containing protein
MYLNLFADRLRESVRTAPLGSEWAHLPPIALSIGWAQMAEEDTLETMIARADEALYKNKASRRKANR